jgi:hypothetical protein
MMTAGHALSPPTRSLFMKEVGLYDSKAKKETKEKKTRNKQARKQCKQNMLVPNKKNNKTCMYVRMYVCMYVFQEVPPPTRSG